MWILNELLILSYLYLHIVCISKRDYHTYKRKSRAKFLKILKNLDNVVTSMLYVNYEMNN